MGRRVSEKTKKNRKMGEGTGKDYRPYITTSEFNSQGTTSVIRDWKTDRGVHCLSQGEMLWYYILRWDDENIDIREQYPLDYGETVRIAEKMGFTPPKDRMTTDLLVTRSDGSYIAYSVKPDRDLGERQLQLLCVEKQYWIKHGVPYKLIFKTDANRTLATNIRLVTEFYDPNTVFDVISAVKHKIAIKEYSFPMETKMIDNEALLGLLEVKNE